ncbi:TPA: hypothetical protein ACH7RV_005018, partial [Escherichia coli]
MNTNIYKTPYGVFWCVFGCVLGFIWRVTKDVAGLLFLLRRLTRRGRNAACGQCPASGG